MSSTGKGLNAFGVNKRILLVAALIFFSLSLLAFSNLQTNKSCTTTSAFKEKISSFLSTTSDQQPYYHRKGQSRFVDLNRVEATSKAKKRQEKVLILTPLKNAARYLPRYMELIDRLAYPKHLISIAFLVSDTTDDTVNILHEHADRLLNRRWNGYDSITVFEKDFHFELPEDKRHSFELQPLRRSYMAKSRNYLLSVALREDHSWVLWLDVDVVDYPSTILEDLQSVDVDVVVPNCLRETEDGSFWGYDKNNWQETVESRKIQETLEPGHVLLEGYYEFLTQRYLMVDMPTHGDKLEKVPLDGVGATFTLVKAHVHREGCNFPAYPFQHQVETEGFAKIAKAMGYGVYGLPAYLIYHISNA